MIYQTIVKTLSLFTHLMKLYYQIDNINKFVYFIYHIIDVLNSLLYITIHNIRYDKFNRLS